ncbi:MAG: DUF748 domain-containing protein [Candidatus Omnitrophota bacterium]
MRKILIFIMVLVVIVLLIHISIFAFINIKGEDFLVTAIKTNTGIDASMESLTLKFPFILEIKNFECDDLFFERVSISLGFTNPFALKLILNKVFIEGLNIEVKREKSKFYLEPIQILRNSQTPKVTKKAIPSKEKDVSTVEAGLPENTASAPAVKKTEAISKEKSFSLEIKSLYLKNSSVQFSDLTAKKPIVFSLEDVNLRIRNFTYPQLSNFYIKLVSSLKVGSKKIKDIINAEGWIDYNNKSMDVDFNIDSIDYFSFSEYYPDSWQAWSSVIEEAEFSLASDLISQENNLVIDCSLSLDKMAFKAIEESEENQKAISRIKTLKTAVAFLKKGEDKPELHFKIKTKMDAPNLDFSSLKDSIKGIISVGPITVIGETINKVKKKIEDSKDSGLDTTEDIIKGAIDIFKGILDR